VEVGSIGVTFVKFLGLAWPAQAMELLRVSFQDLQAFRDALMSQNRRPDKTTLRRHVVTSRASIACLCRGTYTRRGRGEFMHLRVKARVPITLLSIAVLSGCGRRHEADESYVLVAANTSIAYWQDAAGGLAAAGRELGVRPKWLDRTLMIPKQNCRK
jgi:hypothetical protein